MNYAALKDPPRVAQEALPLGQTFLSRHIFCHFLAGKLPLCFCSSSYLHLDALCPSSTWPFLPALPCSSFPLTMGIVALGADPSSNPSAITDQRGALSHVTKTYQRFKKIPLSEYVYSHCLTSHCPTSSDSHCPTSSLPISIFRRTGLGCLANLNHQGQL